MRCLLVAAGSVLLVVATARPAEEAIFAPGAKLKVEAEGGAGGEGPAWHPELGVLSSGNGHVCQLDRAGKTKIYRKDAGTNGLLFDRKGLLLACDSGHRRIIRIDPEDGKLTVLTDRYEGKRYNSPNDVVVQGSGAVYFTDPTYGIAGPGAARMGNPNAVREIDIQGVYRVAPDGQVTLAVGTFTQPNGLAFSPDEQFLYIGDSQDKVINRYRVQAQLPLPERVTQQRTIGEVLGVLVDADARGRRKEPALRRRTP